MCLDDQILNTYLDGELKEPWKSQIEEHLTYCSSCRIRSENIKYLRKTIKNACISDNEIQVRKDRVFSILEKNYLCKKDSKSMWHKQIRFKVSQLVGAAAAFVVVFVGSWTVVGSGNEKAIPFPQAQQSVVDIANITPARSIETKKTLDSYSLEEILKNLDARGYEVDISLKGIHPLDELPEKEIEENSTNKIPE